MAKELAVLLASVADPRKTDSPNFRHKLMDMLLLEVIARMAKCVYRKDIIEYGKAHLAAFRRMGILEKGVPSEPTLCRMSQNINSEEFATALGKFVEEHMLVESGDGFEIKAIDGKCANGTTLDNGRPPDTVSVHSVGSGMSTHTEMCGQKSNEITADPKVILKGVKAGDVVTLDAMGCQKAIIDLIRSIGAHYLIEVKANQKALMWAIEDRVRSAPVTGSHTTEPELVGGRIEQRTYRTHRGEDVMVDKDKWGAGQTVLEVESDVTFKSTGKTTTEIRYYISDLGLPAGELGSIARRHWRCEVFHWHLDRNLKQDDIIRKSIQSVRFLDTIQRLCLNLLAKWRLNRKKEADRARGNAELLRKCQNHFTFIKQILSLD